MESLKGSWYLSERGLGVFEWAPAVSQQGWLKVAFGRSKRSTFCVYGQLAIFAWNDQPESSVMSLGRLWLRIAFGRSHVVSGVVIFTSLV